MTRTLAILAAAVAIAASGSALAATPRAISVSPASTTAGVATLELVDPIDWSGRSIPTHNGVHYGLCDRGPLRPCNLGRGALAARRQAVELARAAFRDTDVDLVVVGLPQSPTRHALLVFERDLLSDGLDPLAATAQRVYAMGGLVAHSETDDSLVLVRLRPWPAAPSGR
jgi:hypothetical protein